MALGFRTSACNRLIRMCSSCLNISRPLSCSFIECQSSRIRRTLFPFSSVFNFSSSLTQPIPRAKYCINKNSHGQIKSNILHTQSQRVFSSQSFLFLSKSFSRNKFANNLSCDGSKTCRLYSTDESQSHLPPKTASSRKRESAKKSPISWTTFSIVAVISGAIAWGMNSVRKEKEELKRRKKQIGKPLLGGPWELTDHNGNVRSSKDFHGQWILIYFGFTNCPDICPDYIEKIVDFISKADEEKSMPKIQPLVITVDPARDTPAILKEYLAEFSSKLLGLTGTKEAIDTATRAYRVYYSQGPKDEDNDYIVDHSIISYLVNPKGDFVDYFGQNKTSEEMFQTSKAHIIKYNKSN